MKIYPKKSLGQNFLTNQNVKNKIIQSCDLQPNDIVIEIGPGKGMLTQDIIPLVKQTIVVEKDNSLVPYLKEKFQDENLEIIHEDILKFKIPKVDQKVMLIGNIPYNISTPIVEFAIKNRQYIDTFFMTVQYEFGKRLAATPNNKNYGSLTCFAQFYSDIQYLFKIRNTSFFPAPKVESCFLKMKFLDNPRHNVEDEQALFRMIKQTFTKRRKTILNALIQKNTDKPRILEILNLLNIPEKARPENLSIADFVGLYKEMNR